MPTPREIKIALEATIDEWEQRSYLGMSAIGECPRRLYHDLIDGRRSPSRRQLRYCHEGYLHQDDVIQRLHKAGFRVTNCNRELVAPFDHRFRGHIDGEVLDGLLEVKSVSPTKFDRVRHRGPLAAHWDQVQAYMHYGGYDHALIVYKNRDTGELWCVAVSRTPSEGQRLEQKARAILAAVDRREPPECTCGRCKDK